MQCEPMCGRMNEITAISVWLTGILILNNAIQGHGIWCYQGNLASFTELTTCAKSSESLESTTCYTPVECTNPGEICETYIKFGGFGNPFTYTSGCQLSSACSADKGSLEDCVVETLVVQFASGAECKTCCNDAHYCNNIAPSVDNPFTVPATTTVGTTTAPTTVTPTTTAPSTATPTTTAPSTVTPTTTAPSTVTPTTIAPSTVTPTTIAPTTVTPTTIAPTTVTPTTTAPSTVTPTTTAPSTATPTTTAPSTVTPTTTEPTTVTPTTTASSTVTLTSAATSTTTQKTAAPSTVPLTPARPSTVTPTPAAPSTVTQTTVAPSTATPTKTAPSASTHRTAASSTVTPRTTAVTLEDIATSPTIAPSTLTLTGTYRSNTTSAGGSTTIDSTPGESITDEQTTDDTSTTRGTNDGSMAPTQPTTTLSESGISNAGIVSQFCVGDNEALFQVDKKSHQSAVQEISFMRLERQDCIPGKVESREGASLIRCSRYCLEESRCHFISFNLISRKCRIVI